MKVKELKEIVNAIDDGYDNCFVASADTWSDENGYEYIQDLVSVKMDCWDAQGGAFLHLMFE
jgi:hypothetical protein